MALLLPIALLGLFYVFLIRPKQREMKRHNALVSSLEVGDEVMTGSGFYGTLTSVDADIVMVRLGPGLEVKMARRAIAAKIVDQDAAAAQHEAAELESEPEVDTADGGGVIDGVTTDGEPVDDREDRP